MLFLAAPACLHVFENSTSNRVDIGLAKLPHVFDSVRDLSAIMQWDTLKDSSVSMPSTTNQSIPPPGREWVCSTTTPTSCHAISRGRNSSSRRCAPLNLCRLLFIVLSPPPNIQKTCLYWFVLSAQRHLLHRSSWMTAVVMTTWMNGFHTIQEFRDCRFSFFQSRM